MRDLRKDLREYIDLRRALGYKLRKHERRLSEFVTFLEVRRTDHITTRLAVTWVTESSRGHRHSCFERLSYIRSFATHVSSMDSRTEIPPTGTMRRPTIALRPYIYSGEEIVKLMAAGRNLFSWRRLRCHTYYHLIGLLATTGSAAAKWFGSQAPGPDPPTPIPHETIRKINEYVEQRQRLLNRKQRAARVPASEVDRIQQAHRDLHLGSKTPPKSAHDVLRLTSQCSSIRDQLGSSGWGIPKAAPSQALSDPSAHSYARGSTN